MYKNDLNSLFLMNQYSKPFQFDINPQMLNTLNRKSGVWTNTQNQILLVFLRKNRRLMQAKPFGNLWIIYKEIAHQIKTRNFRQCKSYFQKLHRQNGSISGIINQLQIALLKERNESENKNTNQVDRRTVHTHSFNDRKNHSPLSMFYEKGVVKEDHRATDSAYNNQDLLHNQISLSSLKKAFQEHDGKMSNFLKRVEPKNRRQQKLQQCHQMYLEWTEKLAAVFSFKNQ